MSKIRLLLADDHAIIRTGLKTLLDGEPDIEVVAEAADGEETVRKCLEVKPDIVVMDISMPGMSGLEATEQIKSQCPGTRVLALTMHDDERYLLQALRAGVDSYLPKTTADTELIAAIEATFRGENFIHASMTAGLISRVYTKGAESTIDSKVSVSDDKLSERERAVLRLLAQGYSDREIAEALGVNAKTVATYKTRLKNKLNLNSRAELFRYAMEKGFLDADTGTSSDSPVER